MLEKSEVVGFWFIHLHFGPLEGLSGPLVLCFPPVSVPEYLIGNIHRSHNRNPGGVGQILLRGSFGHPAIYKIRNSEGIIRRFVAVQGIFMAQNGHIGDL